jgi:hypothetical protein
MNADIKARWLAALRSGQYTQTYQQLREENCYCALGVLCDLATQAGVGAWEGNVVAVSSGHWISVSPPEVEVWAGVTPLWASRISQCNDRGDTFAEIADLIEAHL